MKTVLIIAITSDIGRELARRYRDAAWTVIGTHRPDTDISLVPAGCELLPCDLADPTSTARFAADWQAAGRTWDLVIVGAGTEEPIGSFWESDDDAWERCFTINAFAPLRLIRALYPSRNRSATPAVAFFSGSGTNNAAPAYSGYCASKILLIKMCELLDAESTDTSFFIIGPGIVRTKIHEQTLAEPERSGPHYRKVVDFLASAHPGTSHDDIFDCLQWCVDQGKAVVGGRNLSLVFDAWRNGGRSLTHFLLTDPDAYKLRRSGNATKLPLS